MSRPEPPVVLLTGASGGLGAAIAAELAQAGFHLWLGARRQTPLHELAERLRRLQRGRIEIATLDLRSEADIERWVEAAAAEFGRIDVLVNNAAIQTVEPIDAVDVARAREVMDTNFFGPLIASRAVVERMRGRGGQILNIGSEAAFRGLPLRAVYSASKFALRGLSSALRIELADAGIVVSEIHPGYLDTPLHGAQDPALIARYGRAKAEPLGRVAVQVRRAIEERRAYVPDSPRKRLRMILSSLAPRWADGRSLRLFRRLNREYYY